MTRRLTLLCIPATAALRAGRFPADDALEQDAAVRIAAWAGVAAQPDRVLSSPTACARDTAQALGLPVTVDAALREVDYGRWRGQSLKDIGAAEPDALAAWLSDPDMNGHGGESLAAVFDRAGLWLARCGPGHTLAVTHASVIRAVVAQALGAPVRAAMHLDIAPLTLTTLSGHGVAWRVASVAVPVVVTVDAASGAQPY